MDWVTTSTILRDLREFERGATWSAFVERFRRPIISFARRLGHSREDAEDVAQETLATFAEGYREGKYDREQGRLSHWLFGIAYRKALKHRERAAKREVGRGTADDTESFIGSLPDQREATNVWDREWQRSLLDECMRRVREEVEPRTWRTFEMTVLENRPVADVVTTLTMNQTTVYNSKHRVVKRLRELRQELDDDERT